MKKINHQATRIFCALLEKLGTNEHCKLITEGFMPLVIEQIAEDIQTPFGTAKLVSLAHYYEQNGDPMRDPEMVFIVADKRQEKREYEKILIFPQMFQQDNLSVYEESICIEDGKTTTFKPHWYKGHLQFANQWLLNIREQGFLTTVKH